MNPVNESIRAVIERMRASAEDPEFQARLRQFAADDAERDALRAENELLRYLAGSGIPRLFWNAAKAPHQTDAVAALRPLVAGDGPRVVILGGPAGRGKTTALAWATLARRGRFIEAHDVFRLSSFAESEWADLQETPLLALDEAGAEFLGDKLQQDLFSVLNARIQNLRPTAIATNLSLADFRARFLRGPLARLDDRLNSVGAWVSLPGPSMRRHWSEPDP